jgi:hypothetical protein
MFKVILLLFSLIREGFRTRTVMQAEILALRHQLLVLQRSGRGHRSQINSTAPVNQAAQNIGRLSSSCGSIDAMNKRKSSRITGVFVILFGFLPLLNSLSNPRLASAHGSDRLQLIAVGLCFGIGACLLAGLFRFPGE